MARRCALVVALVLASPSLAQAGIDDLAGTKPGELDFGGQFESAETCALCHGGGFAGDRSYLPHDSWAGTMMGNAARDPVFRAALAIANQDEPGVGTFCLRCHSPIAFVRGHATPTDGSAFDAVDMQGIGCDTCHRAVPSGPATAPYYVSNAQIVYSNELHKRGPYDDSVVPVHSTMGDAALSTSHFCGQCHQVTNPLRMLRDASGVQTNLEFPLDTTYQEWQNSDFPGEGTGCISCHAQRSTNDRPVATSANAPIRQNPRKHAFVAANLQGIRLVMAANPAYANAYPDAFAVALQETQIIQRASVGVQFVSVPKTTLPGASIPVTVRVTNFTGHKFPTGYAEGRRAWIALVLVSPDGGEIFLRGGYDVMTGEIVNASSTHVYRAQHGHWNGVSGEPSEDLARHNMILSDTRIPPKGFVAAPTTVPTSEIDYGTSGSGFRHYDEASFDLTIPVDARVDSTLSVRVYYQPLTRAYIEHLAKTNSTNSSGQDLLAAYESFPDEPTLLAYQDVPLLIGKMDPSSSVSGGMGGSAGASGTNGAGGAEIPPPAACNCMLPRDSRVGFGAAALFSTALVSLVRRKSRRLSKRNRLRT